MNLKKLFVTVLALAGVYSQNHGMDIAGLYQAIVNGNVKQVKKCIKTIKTFNPNSQYGACGCLLPDGRFFVSSVAVDGLGRKIIKKFSPLHLACGENQLAVVRLLVEKYGAAVNETKGGHSTVLHRAGNNLNSEIVRYLLSKGAKVKSKWIEQAEIHCAGLPKNDPRLNDCQRILYLLKGRKIVCGVVVTRMNVGIMVAVGAVCAVACKCIYDRYYAARKKSTSDDDEAENVDAHDENKAVDTDQKVELA